MELIFLYAGTASLADEMEQVLTEEPEIGDVLILGGHPGHAVIIVDKTRSKDGASSLYLLAQSYMPAQELQLLTNPCSNTNSPWYRLDQGPIHTPEWTFITADLMRFSE